MSPLSKQMMISKLKKGVFWLTLHIFTNIFYTLQTQVVKYVFLNMTTFVTPQMTFVTPFPHIISKLNFLSSFPSILSLIVFFLSSFAMLALHYYCQLYTTTTECHTILRSGSPSCPAQKFGVAGLLAAAKSAVNKRPSLINPVHVS